VIRKTSMEALMILVIGAVLALLANALSPRGLSLTRNYFPEVTPAPVDPGLMARVSLGAEPDEDADATSAAGTDPLEARLRQRGLERIDLEEVRALFEDDRYAMELVILVDARTRRHYLEGHVPGAYLLDHFRPEATLLEVLPASLAAEQVIVYCSGGECEDSEFTAIFLRDAGVPGDRLRIYTGGLLEWRQAGLPIELGQRGSGLRE
jgi:rhodanese-related sulfurtransferase